MKSVLASRHFCCFDCQSRILFFFCYLAFVSSGFFRLECGSKCPVNESELLCGYMAFDLRLFAHSSSSPKKKIHKKVVEYSTDRPSTHLRRKFNWFQLSTFLQEKKIKLSATLSQWTLWNFCNLPSLWSEVHNLIPVYRITPFCSEALVSSPNLVLPACSLALDDNYNKLFTHFVVSFIAFFQLFLST